MSGAITGALDWRWTFRILGIIGMAMLPLAMMALWEPKRIREKRKKRLRGKSYYTLWVRTATTKDVVNKETVIQYSCTITTMRSIFNQ